MKVMFVDDQSSVLDGIAAGVHFQELGVFSVRYANGTDSALARLQEESADLVFCDVEMPGRNGMELAREIRERWPDTLVVLLTSHAEFEYAQESMRLGCFDYILQPAPYEVIEQLMQRARQLLQERGRRSRLYEIGSRMRTSGMELLDSLTLGLLNRDDNEQREAIEMLNLLDYPLDTETPSRLLLFHFSGYRHADSALAAEKEIHRALSDAMKRSELSFSALHLSTLDHRGRFLMLLFPADRERGAELSNEDIRRLFECLCAARPHEPIQCCAGARLPLRQQREEFRKLRDEIDGKQVSEGLLFLSSAGELPGSPAEKLAGDSERWSTLLATGQRRTFLNEVEACLHSIETMPSGRGKALCDLHQRLTHVFFSYFYENGADVHRLFRSQYTYNEYMSSFSDPETMRIAVAYMLRQTEELEQTLAPENNIEKAKTFISENLSNPITVKDVADHVFMSPEYFTKLFKRETGQNIKEYITLTKIAAAKDMLEHSSISVGMIALELGYTNFSHFSQVFRKYENMSPSEYRSKLTGEEEP